MDQQRGQTIFVNPSVAGTELPCTCGRTNTVPSLSKLRRSDGAMIPSSSSLFDGKAYFFDCECGRRIVVPTSHVGETVNCACGKSTPTALSMLSSGEQPPGSINEIRSTAAGLRLAETSGYLQLYAAVSILILVVAIAIDFALLASVDRVATDGTTPIRIAWGIVMLLANAVTFYGAWQMRSYRAFGLCRAAAMLAMIPLLNPCCLFGIPFGWNAYRALNDPAVRAAFTD